MKTIKNTTHRPLRVPLPRGGTLHLGPLHTGEVGQDALDHPPFQKLVEAGSIEVLGEGDHSLPHPTKKESVTAQGGRGPSPAAPVKPSGDR